MQQHHHQQQPTPQTKDPSPTASSSKTSPKGFVVLLVLESGMLATFAVLDLMLFFLAFEMVLIPMYFLIARWGGRKE
jgi:NADH:ubiquinone oxidoreductase subunit 4 (subunit M)